MMDFNVSSAVWLIAMSNDPAAYQHRTGTYVPR
jgi:hypothetical protein